MVMRLAAKVPAVVSFVSVPPPPPPSPPAPQLGQPKKRRTSLIAATVAGVLIVIVLVSLIFSGIIPLLRKSGSQSGIPETAQIGGLLTDNGTLIADGATTSEKVLSIHGNVTNPAPTTNSSTTTTSYTSGTRRDQLVSFNSGSVWVQPVEDRVFNGKVLLLLNDGQRYLDVTPLPITGGVDLWQFQGNVVLEHGTNTFQINVVNNRNQTVGQSRIFTVKSTVPITNLRITLTWDTDYSDMDLHVWHFPYIQLGQAGGMDGNGGWWQWYGQWQGVAELSPWIANDPSVNDYNSIEGWTWTNYSYSYNQQSYSYGDGVGHAWYQNKTGITGAAIDVDKTDGYGPEIFTMTNARPGLYTVVVRMYNTHGINTTTTATVTAQAFQQAPLTFSHTFAPTSQGDDVVQYPSNYNTQENDFPQANISDWVAYSFYVLPDKTVAAPQTKSIDFSADCQVSSTGNGYFRDRWFLLDHATNISSLISGWVSSGWGMLTLERLGEDSSGSEVVVRIVASGIGYQPGGVWQGATQDLPPGLYHLSAGNTVEGYNSIDIEASVLSSS